MFAFLEQYYATTRAEDVGALLGSMALLPDGQPADRGIAAEWERAVARAASDEGAVNLALGKPNDV
jgi:hypothetical protein